MNDFERFKIGQRVFCVLLKFVSHRAPEVSILCGLEVTAFRTDYVYFDDGRAVMTGARGWRPERVFASAAEAKRGAINLLRQLRQEIDEQISGYMKQEGGEPRDERLAELERLIQRVPGVSEMWNTSPIFHAAIHAHFLSGFGTLIDALAHAAVALEYSGNVYRDALLKMAQLQPPPPINITMTDEQIVARVKMAERLAPSKGGA